MSKIGFTWTEALLCCDRQPENQDGDQVTKVHAGYIARISCIKGQFASQAGQGTNFIMLLMCSAFKTLVFYFCNFPCTIFGSWLTMALKRCRWLKHREGWLLWEACGQCTWGRRGEGSWLLTWGRVHWGQKHTNIEHILGLNSCCLVGELKVPQGSDLGRSHICLDFTSKIPTRILWKLEKNPLFIQGRKESFRVKNTQGILYNKSNPTWEKTNRALSNYGERSYTVRSMLACLTWREEKKSQKHLCGTYISSWSGSPISQTNVQRRLK